MRKQIFTTLFKKIKGGLFRRSGIIIIALLIFFFLVISFDKLPLTGFFIFGNDSDGETLNNEKSVDKIPIEESEDNKEEISIIVSDKQEDKPKSSSSWWKYGLEDNNIQRGYFIRNLRKGLSLWLNGYFLNPQGLYRGKFRFALYADLFKVSEFDLNVDRDIDMSEVLADISVPDGKSYIHSPLGLLKNMDLFIPREPGQTRVRICQNASSYEQIYKGCSNDSRITKEYVLELDDENLKLSEDGKFFIVKNVLGTGGMGEGKKQKNKTDFSIELISPVKNAGGYSSLTIFYYNVSNYFEIDSCSLVIDGQIRETDYDVERFQIHSFTVYDLLKGKHFWEIRCEDVQGGMKTSEKRKITVILVSGDFEMPEGLDKENIERINNLTLKKSGFGAISFLETVNLSEIVDFSEYVSIKKNFISIDSEKMPHLNKSAILTLYDLKLDYPVILRNGEPCRDCEILDYNGNLTFKVESFSNYSASGNSQLGIWDDSDMSRVTGGNISFYSNYTNITDGSPITGATCAINFTDSSSLMAYNSSSKLYEYVRNFSGIGVYNYNVSCSAVGFTSINLTDYVSINSGKGVNGADVTHIKTEMTNVSSTAGNHSAYAGNVTELTLDAVGVTQSWQGYFGNVTGVIGLSDGSGNILYNWSVSSPNGEVYATRAFDVNFVTISCATTSQISSEENFINQSSGDSDSVSNTFNKKSHPGFYVGGVEILGNSCNSTNLYDSGGAQTTEFYEVLLADGASNMVYTSLLEQDATGFDSKTHDFEMIVGEDGHAGDTNPTNYYFYVELQ
jgi:hypothetical protein